MPGCQLWFDRLELTAVSFVARAIEGLGLEAKFSVSVQIAGGLLLKRETAKHSQAVLCWSGIKGVGLKHANASFRNSQNYYWKKVVWQRRRSSAGKGEERTRDWNIRWRKKLEKKAIKDNKGANSFVISNQNKNRQWKRQPSTVESMVRANTNMKFFQVHPFSRYNCKLLVLFLSSTFISFFASSSSRAVLHGSKAGRRWFWDGLYGSGDPNLFSSYIRSMRSLAGVWIDIVCQRKTNKELFAAKHQKHTRPDDLAYARNELEILTKVTKGWSKTSWHRPRCRWKSAEPYSTWRSTLSRACRVSFWPSTLRWEEENKLASLKATLVQNSAHWLTHSQG